jgi:hypothetical protein
VTPEDIARLMSGNPSNRRITVEIVVIEQTRESGDAPWTRARKLRQVTLWDAALKMERTVTEKGDHMVVTAAGTPEEVNLAFEQAPVGMPS